jgi:hypothetical protein
METSTNLAPAAPDTRKVAVGLLIAEALSKSNKASKKQLESQKSIDQEFMEQSISTAIQNIVNNAPDHPTALAEIKKFLSEMSGNDSTWGSEIQSWITGELNKANSYNPPQNLVDQLNDDMRGLAVQGQFLQNDESNLNSVESEKDNLVNKLNGLKDEWNGAPWYEKLAIAAEIGGIAIAIGAVYIAIGACEAAVAIDKGVVDTDQKNVARDKKGLLNDPGLTNTLAVLSSGNNLMQSEANQAVASYQAVQSSIRALDKAIGSIEFKAGSK